MNEISDKALTAIIRDIALADLQAKNAKQEREIWHLKAFIVQMESRVCRQVEKIRHYEDLARMN